MHSVTCYFSVLDLCFHGQRYMHFHKCVLRLRLLLLGSRNRLIVDRCRIISSSVTFILMRYINPGCHGWIMAMAWCGSRGSGWKMATGFHQ